MYLPPLRAIKVCGSAPNPLAKLEPPPPPPQYNSHMSSSLIHGGTILNPSLQHSAFSLQPVEALFVQGGKIAAAGRLSDLENLATSHTQRVNLEAGRR